MEMVGALFAGTVSALGSAATAAAGSLGTIGAIGSTALTAFQGVATAGSVLMGLSSAGAGAAQAQQQAQLEQARATQEGLQGQQQALDIQRNLLQRIGAARVGFAASGIDISAGGTEGAIEGDLTNQAGYQTAIAKGNAALRQGSAQVSADAYNAQATSSLIKGVGNAASAIGGFRLSVAARG